MSAIEDKKYRSFVGITVHIRVHLLKTFDICIPKYAARTWEIGPMLIWRRQLRQAERPYPIALSVPVLMIVTTSDLIVEIII